MNAYGQLHGTHFYHPQWWKSWYDAAFQAEHLDPSRTIDFDARVEFMHRAYGPLTDEIQRRFRGQGRSADRVFRRSLEDQALQMSPAAKEQTLRRAARAKAELKRREQGGESPVLKFPIGLHIKDPFVRMREDAVRRLLSEGVLRTADLIEALLQTAPQDFMPKEAAEGMLLESPPAPRFEGELPLTLGIRVIAIGLEALEPAFGDSIVDVTARSAYMTALLSHLVGPRGKVLGVHPGNDEFDRFCRALVGYDNVEVAESDGDPLAVGGTFDGVWIGAALPRIPTSLRRLLEDPDGRAIAFIGPRFRRQDLVSLTLRDGVLDERRVARAQVPVLAGPGGWLRAPNRTALVAE
jgi:protein-L-isoaspartate O-methyltransferase